MTKTAMIVAFPLNRRVRKVRTVAENLSLRNGNAAASYWKQTVSTLANQMDRNGVDRDEIKHELRAFFYAVQNEMTRLAHDDRGTGGAA